MAREVIIETSARHAHISKEHLEILFGKGHALTPKKELSQPGQFACEEKITVEGPKGSLKMSILGPVRPSTQVEISATDARSIGLTAPIRESGDIKGSTGVKITGPCGSVTIDEGVIIAKRHIHLTPDDAKKLNLTDKQVVYVKAQTEGRTIVFGDVVVRVSDKFSAAMHIDTDEANAGSIPAGIKGTIIDNI